MRLKKFILLVSLLSCYHFDACASKVTQAKVSRGPKGTTTLRVPTVNASIMQRVAFQGRATIRKGKTVPQFSVETVWLNLGQGQETTGIWPSHVIAVQQTPLGKKIWMVGDLRPQWGNLQGKTFHLEGGAVYRQLYVGERDVHPDALKALFTTRKGRVHKKPYTTFYLAAKVGQHYGRQGPLSITTVLLPLSWRRWTSKLR